jgi:hypothetical protein
MGLKAGASSRTPKIADYMVLDEATAAMKAFLAPFAFLAFRNSPDAMGKTNRQAVP